METLISVHKAFLADACRELIVAIISTSLCIYNFLLPAHVINMTSRQRGTPPLPPKAPNTELLTLFSIVQCVQINISFKPLARLIYALLWIKLVFGIGWLKR